MTTDDLVLRVGALKAIKDYVETAYDEARAEVAKVLKRGARLPALSPIDDTKIGSVTMTEPKRTARISDMGALTERLLADYPDLVDEVYEVNATSEQIRRLVFEHRPEWLNKKQRIDPKVIQRIRALSAEAGAPIGPGGEADYPGVVVERPEPVVTCRSAPGALDAVAALIRAGRIGLDGITRELPGSKDVA